jgi:hypothetical protein
MRSRQSSDAVPSYMPHLTIVNVPIKWWSELPFMAGVPPFYGSSYLHQEERMGHMLKTLLLFFNSDNIVQLLDNEQYVCVII